MDFPRVLASLKAMVAQVFVRPLTSLADFMRALNDVHHNRIALAAALTEEFASFVPPADVNNMLIQQHDMYALRSFPAGAHNT